MGALSLLVCARMASLTTIVHQFLPTDGAKSVLGTSSMLLRMMWNASSGLRDDTCRLAELFSLVKPVKKAPSSCDPGNASPTVKSKEGPRER